MTIDCASPLTRLRVFFFIIPIIFISGALLPNGTQANTQVADDDGVIFKADFEHVPIDVFITSFTVNSQESINLTVGSTATMQWNTTDADVCVASTTPLAALDDWNLETPINLYGPHAVTFPVAGEYSINLDCSVLGGNPANDSVTVRVADASITTFTVSPGTAMQGDNVILTLEWATENTSVCYGSANWPNSTSLPASGTRYIDITSINSSIEYTLTCEGFAPGDEVFETDNVSVTSCNDSVTLSGQTKKWTDVFRDSWPGPVSQQVRKTILRNGYYAVRFRTGDVIDTGLFTNIEASGTGGYRLGSISKCPGDFTAIDVETCTHKWGDSGGIFWDTSGTEEGHCQLEPNQTYYWNMTFTDGVDPDSSRCIGFCETYLVVSNRDYVEN